jgi:hypothetical protein
MVRRVSIVELIALALFLTPFWRSIWTGTKVSLHQTI